MDLPLTEDETRSGEEWQASGSTPCCLLTGQGFSAAKELAARAIRACAGAGQSSAVLHTPKCRLGALGAPVPSFLLPFPGLLLRNSPALPSCVLSPQFLREFAASLQKASFFPLDLVFPFEALGRALGNVMAYVLGFLGFCHISP